MAIQLTPKVEVWVEEVEGKHSDKKRYRFRCEHVPVPEPEKKNGLAAIAGSKPETRVAMLVALVVFTSWALQLL